MDPSGRRLCGHSLCPFILLLEVSSLVPCPDLEGQEKNPSHEESVLKNCIRGSPLPPPWLCPAVGVVGQAAEWLRVPQCCECGWSHRRVQAPRDSPDEGVHPGASHGPSFIQMPFWTAFQAFPPMKIPSAGLLPVTFGVGVGEWPWRPAGDGAPRWAGRSFLQSGQGGAVMHGDCHLPPSLRRP